MLVSAKRKSNEVNKRAIYLAQSTVSCCLTERQVKYKQKSETVRLSAETPQQLAVGLAVHQAVRSKELIKMLHGFEMCVDYNRILRVEAQIESSVLNRMSQNDGVYLPPDIVKSRHVFFAIDNVGFAEDTPDGKRTFHGTAMAIYQRREPADKEPELIVNITNQQRSIRELPESITDLMECPEPPSKPVGRVYPQFGLFAEEELPIEVKMEEFAWLLGRSLTRIPSDNPQVAGEENEAGSDQPAKSTNAPLWSAYNSTISDTMPLTRVGTPPLIASPAHEWQTILTVLMQAQNIKTKVVGPNRRTVMALDMGLYQPAKKLQIKRQDLGHLILRPGELHIVMAQLRAIGAFVENSGLDTCWIESDLYGPATVKQIIGRKHVKRGETAHLVTSEALFALYQEALFRKHPTLCANVKQSAKQLGEACVDGTKEEVKARHAELVQIVTTEIAEKVKTFDSSQEEIPMFKFAREYMKMVMEMLCFIKAVRTGHWDLHLEALKVLHTTCSAMSE